MANICTFEIELKSKNKENLQKMCDWFNAQYNYDQKKPVWIPKYLTVSKKEETTEHHIGSRIYDCDAAINDDPNEEGYYTAYGYGSCAWSGSSIIESEAPRLKYSLGLGEACKMLEVSCTLDTEETDNGFREHYIYNDQGECVKEEYEDLYNDEDRVYYLYYSDGDDIYYVVVADCKEEADEIAEDDMEFIKEITGYEVDDIEGTWEWR